MQAPQLRGEAAQHLAQVLVLGAVSGAGVAQQLHLVRDISAVLCQHSLAVRPVAALLAEQRWAALLVDAQTALHRTLRLASPCGVRLTGGGS